MAHYHTVRQGECLRSIAASYHFDDYHTIYDHPQNERLRELRPNPHVLYPGDRVFIPDPQERQESRGTGQRHRFQVEQPDVMLRIRLVQDALDCAYEERERPLANRRYRLTVAGRTYEGTTTGDGVIEQEVPADAEEGELTVLEPEDEPDLRACTFTLRIGHLDPLDENEGVEGRLNNLGFHASEGVGGQADEQLQRALRRAQTSEGLDATGESDDATKQKLEERHGS